MAALSQDGGVAVDDIARNIPDQDWVALAREFFLSYTATSASSDDRDAVSFAGW
jgi:hypothetical protein